MQVFECLGSANVPLLLIVLLCKLMVPRSARNTVLSTGNNDLEYKI